MHNFIVDSIWQTLLRPDQINYLFHGSGGSVLIALGKIKLTDGGGLACMARQRLLGIATTVYLVNVV